MTVLQEHPPALEDLGFGDELLRPGALTPPQGNHVQVVHAAAQLFGKAQKLGGWVASWEKTSPV